MEGIFTISLDFELHWGVFDKRDRLERKRCYLNTLALIPRMLALFEEYNVHVTWATVGSLFADNKAEWEKLRPVKQPDYINAQYSAYKWAEMHGLDDEYRWAHFAPDKVAEILGFEGQELGTHTFSHYYCLEQLKGDDAFGADLDAASRAASKFGNRPASLVFPRNQFNPQHLKTCFNNGIKTIRSNPKNWFWSPVADKGSGLIRKIYRTGDAYLSLGSGRTSYSLDSIKPTAGEPIQLPASRFLRPFVPKYAIANKLALRRISNELYIAAKSKECYHLWWHPENFGDYPEQNINNLVEILKLYKKCKERFGMQSWNMGEYADNLLPV